MTLTLPVTGFGDVAVANDILPEQYAEQQPEVQPEVPKEQPQDIQQETPSQPEAPAEATPPSETDGQQAAAPQKVTEPQPTTFPVENNEQPASPDSTPPAISDEAVLAYLKSKGIEAASIDSLKAEPKTEQPAAPPATDKLKDVYLKHGGKEEDFNGLKAIQEASAYELGLAEAKRTLAAEGFTEQEVEEIIEEKYGATASVPEQDYDETDEEFEARKKQIEKKAKSGVKMLEKQGQIIKQQAEGIFSTIRKSIEEEEKYENAEASITAKVADVAKSFPRKMQFELGLVNDQQTAPVEYLISDSDIAAAAESLSSTAKRSELLFNPDGSLNVEAVFKMAVRNKALESAVKVAFIEGGSRQAAVFHDVFPSTPQQVGVGGQQRPAANQPGRFKGFGKPELVPTNSQ